RRDVVHLGVRGVPHDRHITGVVSYLHRHIAIDRINRPGHDRIGCLPGLRVVGSDHRRTAELAEEYGYWTRRRELRARIVVAGSRVVPRGGHGIADFERAPRPRGAPDAYPSLFRSRRDVVHLGVAGVAHGRRIAGV